MRVAKIIPLTVATLLLGCILAWALHRETLPTKTLIFETHTGSTAIQVKAWLDERDSCYYLFLPSYTQMENVTYTSKKLPIIVDGKHIDYGDHLLAFAPNKTYSLAFLGHKSKHKFSIIQSANVATMFLNIDENMLTHVNKNKNVKASLSMTLLSPNGETLYQSARDKVKIKGRGYTTWNLAKKPYNLILDQPESLLGMEPATKWVLLANGLDESNLKNKIVYDYAKTLNYCWTPSCEFVEVYINHEYHGLYLLSEKIELSESKMHTDEQPLYLFLLDLQEPNSLHFSNRQYVIGVEGVSDINVFQPDLTRLKDAILNAPTDSCHQLEQVMDIHSWACKYMIDVMYANTDMWWKSHYFYCTGEPPFKFYEGPIWDYDLSWVYPANSFTQGIMSDYLIRNDVFKSHVVNLYNTKGRPYISWLIDSGIDSLATIIQDASQANSIRWRKNFYDDRPSNGWIQPSSPSPDSLKTFLSRRRRFLDKCWTQNIPYNPIYIKMPTQSGNIVIDYEPGLTVAQYINASHSWDDYTNLVWKDRRSGKLYTADSIVDTIVELHLCSATAKQSPPTIQEHHILDRMRYACAYLFFLLLLFLVGYTIMASRKTKKRI